MKQYVQYLVLLLFHVLNTGAKEFQGSSQSHIEELKASTASVISIRDAMLIPLVDYKNNDFRTFIFVLHKDHGLMILHFKNKILKRDDYKIPGGRTVEKEFMASGKIRRLFYTLIV